MGAWDTPPTADELRAADPWASPPTADEVAGRATPAIPMGASHKPVPFEKIGKAEAGIRGALQGASFGFGDEAAGAIDALLPNALRNQTSREAVGAGQTFGERYRNARDFYRARNAQAEKEHGPLYLASQVAGATAPTLIGAAPLTGARAAALAAGQGAAQGAGYSDAASARGLVGDTALGAGLGLAGYGAGQVVGKGLSALGRKAGERLGLASARAGSQAAGEVAEDVASKVGQLGAETQKGSRYIENLMRLKESMTPAQRALFEQLETSGVVPGLQQSVAQGTLEALPSQAATIAAKKAAVEAAQQAAPQAVADRTAELLKPQVGADAKSFLKAYAEPILWAGGTAAAGHALGLPPEVNGVLSGAAGIVGGRTRAGKALWTRINRPGNQAAIARAMQSAADAGNSPLALTMRRLLTVGATAPAVAALEGP